jgi:streptogramin lyase
VRVTVGGEPTAIVAAEEATWVLSPDTSTLTRLDRNAPARRAKSTALGGNPVGLALGVGALWVVDRAGSVRPVGRVNAQPEGDVHIGGSPVAIATGPGSMWVVDGQARELVELDPETGERVRAIPVEKRPVALAVAVDAVWVANAGARTVSRVTP